MSKSKCCVCGREWPDERIHTLQLTAEEKAHIKSLGKEAPESYPYCFPCWKILSDKVMGAQLIKGLIQSKLRASGVQRAELLSQVFFQRLIGLKPKG